MRKKIEKTELTQDGNITKETDQWQLIKHIYSGNCLVAGAEKEQVLQKVCNPFSPLQHFKIVADGDNVVLVARNSLIVEFASGDKILMGNSQKSNTKIVNLKLYQENFQIYNPKSLKCLGIISNQTKAATCASNTNFIYSFIPMTNYWHIKTSYGKLKCLTTKGDTSGSATFFQECNYDNPNQHFKIQFKTGENMTISLKNGLTLTGPTVIGEGILLAAPNDSLTTQLFQIGSTSIGLSIRNAAGGCITDSRVGYNGCSDTSKHEQTLSFEPIIDWNLVKEKTTGKCLSFSSSSQNAQLKTKDCSWKDSSQQFRVEYASNVNGSLLVKIFTRTSLVIENQGGKVTNLSDTVVGNSHLWKINPNGNFLQLLNPVTNKCANVKSSIVEIGDCSNSDSQMFEFITSPWNKLVMVKSLNQLCLSSEVGVAQVKQVKCNINNDNQQFLTNFQTSYSAFLTKSLVYLESKTTTVQTSSSKNLSLDKLNWRITPVTFSFTISPANADNCFTFPNNIEGTGITLNICDNSESQLAYFVPVYLVRNLQ